MGGDAESPAMNGMTAAHNKVRAEVNPAAATPIPPLTWSSNIAAVAQAHAEKCIWEHSSNSYGENIYATSGGGAPQGVVSSWASEVSDYDYASNSCKDVCGHYTQVVWANSLRLGCGMAQCTKNSPFGSGDWEMWVCNYDPPGNYGGQKPY
jgi:pathogenesis-related protein 1